ncbi:MAG TPA: glycosyltransferase family 2 protein [Candidatus Methylomirabilis sp.]|nr:glycosyltransferase family 2 protein [Candidatus Methylomirabilis sp.]
MTVAVVVPSLDQGRFLPEALGSLLGQESVDVKVAVMDGGSRDDSVEIIQRHEDRLSYWRSGPDAGQAAAINEGIARLGPADHVGWLNADDLLLPGGLEKMAAYLTANPGCVAVFGEADVVDEAGRVIGRFPTQPFSRRALARASIICQPASLIRASAWRAVGGLDASLHLCLDYDLWWRLSAIGPIGFLPDLIARSRDHETTKTRSRHDLMYREAFAVLTRHLRYVPWRWCLSEAAYRWREGHGGRRADSLVSQAVCACRAAGRHARVNGVSGIVSGLRELW